MTQQEYEQKKRECWEEYVSKHGMKNAIPEEPFSFTFDRAYALGKQTEAITQEEIEKAAQEHADELRVSSTIPAALVPLLHDIAKSSYLQGVQDFIGKQEIKQEIKQETDADTVISGWVARDEDGSLTLFYGSDKPSKKNNDDYWSAVFGNTLEYLPQEMFPDIKWEDAEPTKVEIIIKRKKK